MGNFEQHAWTVGNKEKIVDFLGILRNYKKLPLDKQEKYLTKNGLDYTKAKQFDEFISEKYRDGNVSQNEYADIIKYMNSIKNTIHKTTQLGRLNLRQELEQSNKQYIGIIKRGGNSLWKICMDSGININSKTVKVIWENRNPNNIEPGTKIYKKLINNKIHIILENGNSNTIPKQYDTNLDSKRINSKIKETKETKAGVIQQAIDLIIKLEGGFVAESYSDHKQYSRGYGTKAPGKDKKVSKEQAKKELQREVYKTNNFIDKNFPEINDNQKIALISFFYNTGTSKKGKANLIWRLKNMGKNIKDVGYIAPNGVANMLIKYVNAGGRKSKGLLARRKIEVKKFLS